MRIISLFTLLGWLFAAVIAAPASPLDTRESSLNKRLPSWQWYFGVNAAQHQVNFNKWSAAGYRMISLSAYGAPPNNLYAAVWVQRSGPGWVAIHEASASAYQTWFDKYAAAGFVSTIVTVTGPANTPIYAGVMEQNGVNNWYQKCGLTQAAYNTELSNAQNNRYILKAFAEYGPAGSYCGLWYINNQYDKYTSFVSESYADYQTTFNSQTTKPYWRPSYLSVSEGHTISSTFTDTDVGSWVARHGMTGAQLQAEYTTQQAAGRYIIHLQGGGTGANANFAALFADYDVPTARTWRTTGTITGFQNNGAAQAAADSLMQTFMQQNGVRQAQLSIGKNGKILLEKGYSWSEANRHTTVPTDVFLLASNSKMFLEAAIQTLITKGSISLSTLVYPFLGYTSTPDPRLQQITVNELLTHYGGLDSSVSGFDVTYSTRTVAIAQNTGGAPATVKNIVDYMSKYTLDYTPGARYAYSNYGYVLLSYLVEHVTGQQYYDYLHSAVLAPGSYDVRKWGTSSALHVNEPITQESRDVGPSALTPLSSIEVADIFGGDGMVKEDTFGAAALATSASTLVKFIATHAVWGIGPRPSFGTGGYSAREGSTPGTETWAESRWDGIDWAVTVNTRDWPAFATGQDPFGNLLCQTTIPAFLGANPVV